MRILLPVDGSIHSQNAIRYLAKQQRFLGEGTQVELLNVQNVVPVSLCSMLSLTAIDAFYKVEADKVFADLRPVVDESGLDVCEVFRSGDPGEVIAQEAEDMKSDLIVMGTHGRTPLKSVFLGSVSQKVLSRTKRPVLLIRDKMPETPATVRIGLCADASAYGVVAAEFLAANYEFFGNKPEVTIINVTPGMQVLTAYDTTDSALLKVDADELEAAAKEIFNKAVAPVADVLTKAEIPFKTVRLTGRPEEAICKYAKDNLDLIMMGSHGYGNFKAAALGSVAMHVAAKSDLPLLIIRGE